MQHIGSSNILKAGHDRKTRTLQMVFINRPMWLYTYSNVGIKVWVKFLQSASKGKYFSDFIRDVYPYQKSNIK